MEFRDSIKEFNKEQIYCRHVEPKNGQDPKCLVFICHGFGEHVGRYDALVDFLTNEGMYVFSHDHVGHGKSSGDRVWVENYDVFCIPAKLHIEETAARFPGKKVFLYAHSMGGLIAAKLLTSCPKLVAGVIMESPFLAIPEYFPPWMISLGAFLGRRRLFQKIAVSKVDINNLSRDADVVRSYDEDPLNYHGKCNTRFVASSVDAQAEVFGNAKNMSTPMLIIHGTDDHVCPISAAELLYKEASSEDKTFKVFEGGYHVLRSESYNGIKDSFTKLVGDWINTRC